MGSERRWRVKVTTMVVYERDLTVTDLELGDDVDPDAVTEAQVAEAALEWGASEWPDRWVQDDFYEDVEVREVTPEPTGGSR